MTPDRPGAAAPEDDNFAPALAPLPYVTHLWGLPRVWSRRGRLLVAFDSPRVASHDLRRGDD